jgi:hypothetical protein
VETKGLKAAERFEAARRKAFLSEIVAFLSGRRNELLSWEEVKDKLHLRGQHYRGIESVPVDKIVGSVGRYQDFDRAFLPKQDSAASRWMSVARARLSDVGLPPVSLYKVGDAYFVLDGHHRVSVAREQGAHFVDAEVVEAEARVPVTPDLQARDLEVKGEYTRFLEQTRLDELRPEQRIELTICGGYDRLLEHVAVHRYFMGLEQERFIPEDQAVCDWYDSIYLPLVQLVREKGILADFPGRTEADLYIWIMDHQHFLREQYGPEVESETAAEHFAQRYTTRPLRRLWNWIAGLFSGPDSLPDLEADIADRREGREEPTQGHT